MINMPECTQYRRRLQPRRFLAVPPGLALLAVPATSFAQTQTSETLSVILVLGLLACAAAAGYFYVRARRHQAALTRQADALAQSQKERDEAKAELAAQTEAIEQKLSSQIGELEAENELLSEATARLRKLVVVDELTGLSNRMHFDQVLPHEIKRALREEKQLSIILGRFDWADAFLQSYGKPRFDEAMQKIAEEVRSIFRRAGDLPCRYDKHTFAIIFTSDGDVATRFAQRLCKAVWDIPIPHDASETADRVTFSIGVATIMPDKVHDPADLIAAAETATRIAVDQGGNHVERYRKPPAQPAAV